MSAQGRAAVLAAAGGVARAASYAPDWRKALARALNREVEERRFFLWLPVAAMGGVALNLAADREPVLWLPALLAAMFAGLALLSRARPVAFGLWLALAALFAGFLAMSLRTLRVQAPVLDRIRIVSLVGLVEEIDLRPVGARMVIAVENAEGMPREKLPRKVRVTTRSAPEVAAGDFVKLKARLLPPSHAALPGGYDFARDAFFAGVGAVGSALGPIERIAPPGELSLRERLSAAIDRARNRLALRVRAIIGGDEGAVAAAMVTGKRDFLSSDAKDLIREAGIFHIITISGVQMTLVAGIFFVVTRRLLALSPALALRYPIRKWAAGVAMAGSLLYDVATGSRVGTERALVMTLIVLGAVIMDRRALTMRNLAFAVIAVVIIEPEAITGVSFELSFAAVAALVAVMEARLAGMDRDPDPWLPRREPAPRGLFLDLLRKPLALLFATACATSATASFMAYHFHDLSPYVLIGNPLTLSVIEFFAVPGALLGAALYPLGLDAPVWLYVGGGIKFILWAARLLAALPGATLRLPAFAPYALAFLALAVMSATIWRTWIFRLSAVPLFVVGLIGATHGPRYDVLIDPSGDEAAVRDADGRLMVVGKRFNAFAAEQWLAADGDRRDPESARDPDAVCDRLGCVAALPEGESLSLVIDRLAFDEDCERAEVVVSALDAPPLCKAKFVFDARALAQLGAVGLTWDDEKGFMITSERSALENRPWSPAAAPSGEQRSIRPGNGGLQGADPADPPEER